MYPGFIPHWKRRHCGSYSERAGMGGADRERPWRRGWEYSLSPEEDAAALGFGSGAFGVRRPLRFLAYRLELEEAQVAELAKILDDVKTERAARKLLVILADGVIVELAVGGTRGPSLDIFPILSFLQRRRIQARRFAAA